MAKMSADKSDPGCKLEKSALMGHIATAQKVMIKVADFIKWDSQNKQIIPFDVGNLQRNTTIAKMEDGGAYIEHTEPYSTYVYYGDNMNFQTVNNANAQSRWYKHYEEGGDWYDRVFNFYRREVEKETKYLLDKARKQEK